MTQPTPLQKPLTVEEARTPAEFLDAVAREYNHPNCTIENWNHLVKTYSQKDVYQATIRAMELYHTSQKEKELEELRSWKRQALEIWGPIDDYVQNNFDLKVGSSISQKALEIIRQSKDWKKETDAMENSKGLQFRNSKLQERFEKVNPETKAKIQAREEVEGLPSEEEIEKEFGIKLEEKMCGQEYYKPNVRYNYKLEGKYEGANWMKQQASIVLAKERADKEELKKEYESKSMNAVEEYLKASERVFELMKENDVLRKENEQLKKIRGKIETIADDIRDSEIKYLEKEVQARDILLKIYVSDKNLTELIQTELNKIK